MIRIIDRINAGAPSHPLVLSWRDGVPLTLRQLIAERVRMEWERRYDIDDPGTGPRPLVQPAGIDASIDAAIEHALDGFAANAFFVLVDDRQTTDLDMVIELTPRTEVTFIRLMPLVGG